MPEYTFRAVLPAAFDLEADEMPERLVWVVFTANADFAAGKQDLPYLAHYVAVSGDYLPALLSDEYAEQTYAELPTAGLEDLTLTPTASIE